MGMSPSPAARKRSACGEGTRENPKKRASRIPEERAAPGRSSPPRQALFRCVGIRWKVAMTKPAMRRVTAKMDLQPKNWVSTPPRTGPRERPA
jgi:hypothetical protein